MSASATAKPVREALGAKRRQAGVVDPGRATLAGGLTFSRVSAPVTVTGMTALSQCGRALTSTVTLALAVSPPAVTVTVAVR